MTRSRNAEGGARRPTEKDLAVFLDLVECLDQNEDATLSSIATLLQRKSGRSKPNLSRALERMEQHYGYELVGRRQGSGRLVLTQEARDLADNFRSLFEDRDELLRPRVLPRPRPEAAEVCVGATFSVLEFLLPRAWLAGGPGGEGVRYNFRGATYSGVLADLRQRNVLFGLGPELTGELAARYRGRVAFRPLGPPVDVVLIAHPAHPLAAEARHGQLAPVPPGALAEAERLFVPAQDLAPAVFARLPRTSGSRYEERPNLDTIYCSVQRCHGAGLAPGFYPALSARARAGKIVYGPVPDLGRYRLAAYLPARLRAADGALVEEALHAFEQHLRALTQPVLWPGPVSDVAFPGPAALAEYRHQWHISAHPLARAPAWRGGEVCFTAADGRRVEGVLHDYLSDGGQRSYRIAGTLERGFLLFVATAERGADAFSASFSRCVEREGRHLVGTWQGRDDRGDPITAARIVLSQQPLTAARCHDLVKFLDDKVLTNA
jgi:DNA-binding transcriptional LysR family regulator